MLMVVFSYSLRTDGPDRSTPYEDTLRAVNEEHKKGKFNRFGVSVSHSPCCTCDTVGIVFC